MQNIPTKNTGDSLTAAEFNQIPDELENAITDTGQTLSGADLFQMSKAMAHYAASGDFYTDSGTANAHVIAPIASFKAPTAYTDGMRVRYAVGVTNTTAVTINVNGLGVKDIRKIDGTVLIANTLIAGISIVLEYDSSAGYFVISATNMMGIGQTWRDVSGSRVLGTTYTNTTGRSITVSTTIQSNSVTPLQATITVSGITAAWGSKVDNTNLNSSCAAVVPPGATYIVNFVGGSVVSFGVSELR